MSPAIGAHPSLFFCLIIFAFAHFLSQSLSAVPPRYVKHPRAGSVAAPSPPIPPNTRCKDLRSHQGITKGTREKKSAGHQSACPSPPPSQNALPTAPALLSSISFGSASKLHSRSFAPLEVPLYPRRCCVETAGLHLSSVNKLPTHLCSPLTSASP